MVSQYQPLQGRSDSSMDDCNNIANAAPSARGGRSDSSMDDCNAAITISCPASSRVQIPLWTIVTRLCAAHSSMLCSVQIPLWTIVTYTPIKPIKKKDCSDSSMDDCNPPGGQFPYRPQARSDSSMDDCNQPTLRK